MKRGLVLGWDGATWAVADPLLESGAMPNLQRLRADAAWGPLASVCPPMTLPAWSTFLSGVGPGEHGILDFYAWEGARLRPLTQRDRRVPTLLRTLSDRGVQVGAFLFPTTWPPEALRGGQISGFDSPVATTVPESAFEPRSLHRFTQGVLGRPLHYAELAEFKKGRGWEREAIASLLRSIEDKEKLALALMNHHGPYGLFAMLFGESDSGAHHLWHLWDRNSPRRPAEVPAALADGLAAIYRRLDTALGRLLNAAPWDGVLIASDHGFGGTGLGVLRLNAFLAERGWLRFRNRSRAATLRSARSAIVASLPPRVVEWIVRRAPPTMVAELEARTRWGLVDVERSDAVSDELGYAPSLWIAPRRACSDTERGRIRGGVVGDLLRWRDEQGRPVVNRVIPREEACPGPACHLAPDLFLDLHLPDGYAWNVLPSTPGDPSLGRLVSTDPGTKGAGMPGNHRQHGIYVSVLPSGARGEAPRAIGEVLPAFVDALWPGFRVAQSPGGRPDSSHRPRAGDRADEAALADRLRALGYLS